MKTKNYQGRFDNEPAPWTSQQTAVAVWSGGGAAPFTVAEYRGAEVEVEGPVLLEAQFRYDDSVSPSLQAAPQAAWWVSYGPATDRWTRVLTGYGRHALPAGYRYRLRPGWLASEDPNTLGASLTPPSVLQYFLQRSDGVTAFAPSAALHSREGNVEFLWLDGARQLHVALADTTTPVLRMSRGQLILAEYASGVLATGAVVPCREATWCQLYSRAGTTSYLEALY